MAVVPCPRCRISVVWSPASPYRPFCSERCKNADLGAWASERYAIGDADDDSSSVDSDDGR